jgi:hypothetical protein
MHLSLLTPLALSLLGLTNAMPPSAPPSAPIPVPPSKFRDNDNIFDPNPPPPIGKPPHPDDPEYLAPYCRGGIIRDRQTPLADCEALKQQVMADLKTSNMDHPGSRTRNLVVQLPRVWTAPRCEIRLDFSKRVPYYHDKIARLSEGTVSMELSKMMEHCIQRKSHSASGVFLDAPHLDEQTPVPAMFMHVLADDNDEDLKRLRDMPVPGTLKSDVEREDWRRLKDRAITIYKYYADPRKEYP